MNFKKELFKKWVNLKRVNSKWVNSERVNSSSEKIQNEN